jgi:hypothetical protein
MKRTWLQLVRSCALQIIWCPNFKTEEGGLEQSSKENYKRGEEFQGKSKDENLR